MRTPLIFSKFKNLNFFFFPAHSKFVIQTLISAQIELNKSIYKVYKIKVGLLRTPFRQLLFFASFLVNYTLQLESRKWYSK